jgi:hypothetical protein
LSPLPPGKGNRLRFDVVGQQTLRHGKRGDPHRRCPLQKLAAVDAPVAILVVKIEDLLVDFRLGDGSHCVCLRGVAGRC